MVSKLAPHFIEIRVTDTSEGEAVRWLRPIIKVGRSAGALRSSWRSDAVYISVNAGHGMWLTTALAGVARLARAQVVLHHHSYAYVRERKLRMAALTRVAGPQAHHVVLSESMANDLRHIMPELRRLLVIGNAGLIDRTLLKLPLKADDGDLVLGHLSNLTLNKGVAEVVDLASALHRAGTRVRLVVGGPTIDKESGLHLDRAARELGERFDYRGPLTDAAKRNFFEEITHFVFPSRYVNEAVPLVLYEAMAAGAICVTVRQGSIAEQIEDSASLLAQDADSFVDETLPALVGASASTAASQKSRQAYLRALSAFEDQLARLVTVLKK